MNYQCPLCDSELQKEKFPSKNTENWYCFKHGKDIWFGITVFNNDIIRITIQYPDFRFAGEAVRVIYWTQSELTFITDRFEVPLTPSIRFKPNFSDLEALKKKIKTCFVFS